MNPLCIDLPEGTEIVDGALRVSPNYWCDIYGDKLECIRCPLGYCNQQTRSFNNTTNCEGQREGDLCGSCKEGTTASLLGTECVDSTHCNRFWISPFVAKSVLLSLFFWLTPVGGVGNEWNSLIYVLQTFPILAPSSQYSIFTIVAMPSGTASVSKAWNFCIQGDRSTVDFSFGPSLSTDWLAISFLIVWKRKYAQKYGRFKDGYTDIEESDPSFEGKFTDRGHWIRVLLQTSLFVYSAALATSFQLLRCVTINGEEKLFIDGDFSCSSTESTLVFIFFVVVLVPLPAFLLLLWIIVKRIERNRKQSESELSLSIPHISCQVLILLQSKYHPKFGWWDTVAYSRRTI